MSEKISAFKEFLEKGKASLEANNYYNAIANFNIAERILSDIQAAGAIVDNNDVELLESLSSKAKEANDRQGREAKEKTASQLARLRSTEPVAAAGAKAKKPKILSIFLFGLDAAGKTTFVDYIKQEKFLDHAPTVGVSISRIALGGVQFVFNDVGGQEAYRTNWRNYWKKPDLLVFTVDASDAARFDQAKAYLWDVVKSPEAAKLPLILLSNKIDLPPAKTIEEVKDALAIASITDRMVGPFDISVKENRNIEKVLNFIASIALSDQALRQFVDEKIARLNRNYEEMYKAYVEEAKVLETEGKIDKALDRVFKAKSIKEELFKQGFSKANKEIVKCSAWLAKLQGMKKA
nr:ADP-ribosylation factor-like protein [Candidatus Sigynarchaeota archaeon]